MRGRRVVFRAAVVVTALAGCAARDTHARLSRFERTAESDDREIASLAARIQEFERSVDEVVDRIVAATAVPVPTARP